MNKNKIFIGTYIVVAICTYSLLYGLYYFTQPSFSIIVSSYNYGHYLPDTIDSVLAQKYKKWELILVNDGSSDNTLDVMQKYAQKNNRIKIINQKNQGLSMARNNAMKMAKGDYLWFVDADDFIDKDALKLLSLKVRKTRYPDIVSFWIQPIDSNKNIRERSSYNKLPKEFYFKEYDMFLGRNLPMNVLKDYPVTSGKQIYKRKFIKQHHIQFIPKLIFEDDVFFFTVMQANAKGTTLKKSIYYKRSHTQSIVANKHKYYSSVVKLPIYIYMEGKRVGESEDRRRSLFNWYFNGVFGKYPNNAVYLPDLKALANWIDKQPKDDFWRNNYTRLQDFIREKEKILHNK